MQAYKKMNIDIKNINTIGNRKKVYQTEWMKIYKIMETDFLEI